MITKEEVGSVLRNGALVLQSRISLLGPQVVLCQWKEDSEYVTWMLDGEGYAHHGHYFSHGWRGHSHLGTKEEAFERAVQDFLVR